MNKKGFGPIAIVLAVFLGIVFLVFFAGGGLSSAWDLTKIVYNITNLLRDIPTWAWVIVGILFLIIILRRKK